MIKLNELIEEKALLEKDFKTTNESISKLTNDLAQMKANLNALNGAIQQTNKFISMCQKEADEKAKALKETYNCVKNRQNL